MTETTSNETKQVTVHYSTRSYGTATIAVGRDVDVDNLSEAAVRRMLAKQAGLVFGEDDEFQVDTVTEGARIR